MSGASKSSTFLPAGSGKTAAIRALSDLSGIGIEDIVAFGDDSNDVEMLKLCGIGVAVANAVPEALESADEVSESLKETIALVARIYSGMGQSPEKL